MKQEDKELLLKDLCARLPYGVFCDIYNEKCTITEKLLIGGLSHFCNGTIAVKPYLRPISSMTAEEKKEWHATFESVYNLVPGGDPDNEDDYDDNWHEEPGIESYDYLNAHHFDYRALIEKGLALEAPKGMYN